MPSRIVTSPYRYKRPPRKRKAVLLEVPAIMGKRAPRPQQASAPAPANDGRKPAIVTISKRGRRQQPEPEINTEADARVKAFLARMVRPP